MVWYNLSLLPLHVLNTKQVKFPSLCSYMFVVETKNIAIERVKQSIFTLRPDWKASVCDSKRFYSYNFELLCLNC